MLKMVILNLLKLSYFNKKEYSKAAKSYLKASELNPLEVSYYENAANSFMQSGKDDKAIELLKSIRKIKSYFW